MGFHFERSSSSPQRRLPAPVQPLPTGDTIFIRDSKQQPTGMAQAELTSLPDEILRSVCFFLDWRDAISLQSTNRRFRDVADEHLLWKYYCQCSFRYWAVSHQISSKLADSSFVQWKQLFSYHHEADVRTRSALQGIISSQRARTPKIESIVELDYGAKDELLQSHARASEFDDYLARRYTMCSWSSEAVTNVRADTGLTSR